MFIDAQNLFSENQAVTATANSTNVIDLGVARDIGNGEDLYLMLAVTETMDDTGDNSTLAVTLLTDDNASLSSPTTVRTLVTFAANTPAGTVYYYKLNPQNDVALERYIGLTYTTANGDLSAGKFTAGLVAGIQKAEKYVASGFMMTY